MRLHSRQVKASFWDDPDLLRLHRDARFLFEGLWALADDSGCVYDDPFIFKTKLFPSPVDADLTVERLGELRDELVRSGMLVPYEAEGKRCLFITHFHEHQTLKNPGAPEVPLPPWIKWTPSENRYRSGTYTVSTPYSDAKESEAAPTDTEPSQYSDSTVTDQAPTLEPKNPGTLDKKPLVCSGEPNHTTDMPPNRPRNDYPDDFEAFWQAYPRKKEKRKAFKAWKARLREDKELTPDQLVEAARNYAAECAARGTEPEFIKHGATFLSKDRPFEEYLQVMPSALSRASPDNGASRIAARARHYIMRRGGATA